MLLGNGCGIRWTNRLPSRDLQGGCFEDLYIDLFDSNNKHPKALHGTQVEKSSLGESLSLLHTRLLLLVEIGRPA